MFDHCEDPTLPHVNHRGQLAAQEIVAFLNRDSTYVVPVVEELLYACYCGTPCNMTHVSGVLLHLTVHFLDHIRELFKENNGLFIRWLGTLLPERNFVDVLLMLFLGANVQCGPGPMRQPSGRVLFEGGGGRKWSR